MSHQKMLIVDDEPDVLSALEKRFALKGFDVVTANCASDALILARSLQPDIILMDVLLPGMDGGEVARRLRAMPETAEIPIIFLTGMFPRFDSRRPYRITEDHILFLKPVDMNELQGAVEGLVPKSLQKS
ncbi:MAG TPA: response regulator [Anaerohalosphaeraceae bacterium]|jgi:CheY-like chemotaxis protein|nr:response regulator [Anaerohalosphaeraceae bacterium]